MKAKKLMTLCLVGILAVTTMSSTVFASSTISSQTVSADQETTVKYIPNGGGPSGPIDPDNPDTDPNNWMVYYEKTVDLTQGNINTDGTFATAGTKGKTFSFTVKRQVAGTITTTNPDGMQVSDQNLGGDASSTGAPTYTGTNTGTSGGAIKVTATTANPGDWESATGNITLSANSGTDTPKMNLRTSGNFGAAAIVTETTSILSEMKSTHTTDTPSAAITSGITSLTNDGSSYSVRLTYTFAKAVPTQNV